MTTRLRSGRLVLGAALTVLAGACVERRATKPPATPTRLQTAVAIDRAGNQILVGTFTGSISIAGTTLHSAGGSDIFVAKIRPDGTPAWTPRRYGGPMNDAGTGVAVDPQDDIVVAGSFQGELTLGASRLRPQLRSPDLHALFVAKLDPDGKELWLRQVGVADGPSSVSVAAAPDGKITVGAGVFGRLQKDGKAISASGESILLQSFGPGGEALPTPSVSLLSLESAQCTHSPCLSGPHLVADCDWCVGTICAVDSYCCSTWWDSQCIGEVGSICGQRCDCNALCTQGNPFSAYACPPCTGNVCSADPYCCRWWWDAICVGELLTYCGQHCP